MQDRPPSLSLLALQRKLQEIYRIETDLRVDRFLVSSEEVKEYLSPGEPATPRVLLREEDGQVRLAVYLGDEMQARLEENALGGISLEELVSAGEEVSHFLCLAWRAENDRSVSLLDLELQAEIDKFLLASAHFPANRRLFERLFERFHYAKRLAGEDLARYREANRLGAKLCRTIRPELAGGEPSPGLLQWLRTFYRRATASRLSEVERL